MDSNNIFRGRKRDSRQMEMGSRVYLSPQGHATLNWLRIDKIGANRGRISLLSYLPGSVMTEYLHSQSFH